MDDVFLGAARAEFSLLVKRRNDELQAFFEYSTDQLSPEDAAHLAGRYLHIISTAERAAETYAKSAEVKEP
jgi:hypothetical protein